MKSTSLIFLLFISISVHSQLGEKFKIEEAYQHLSGVIMAVRSDSVLFEGAYGTADGKSKNTLDTRFDIGSITKQFTAAAILHLVKEGSIFLNDPINHHLGNLASKKWSKVTIHHLLTHTGGIPSLYQTDQGLELFLPEEDRISREELVEKFCEAKLTFSPGNEFNYSNSGYILLGVIIENVSGMSYIDFMQVKIFDRYGLKNTTVGKPKNDVIAMPFYGYRDDLVVQAPQFHISWFFASGGIYSNVNDLIKWVKIISSETFLDEKLRSLFLSNHTSVGYGYGWQFPRGEGIIEHDGGNAGFIAMLSFNPETKEAIAILTNRSFEFEDIYNFGKSADYVRNWKNDIWKFLDSGEVDLLPKYSYSDPNDGKFSHQDLNLRMEKKDTTVQVSLSGSYLSRLIPNTSLNGDSDSERKLIDVARYLQKAKYWSLAKHCDGEMKFICYSGMMSIGMRIQKKKVGKAKDFIAYYMDEGGGYGLIRMKGTERILDLIVYFNDEGELIGIFDHGFYSLDQSFSMIAYPVGDNEYYLDGIPYGEKSATLKVDDDGLTFHQFDRSIRFEKLRQ